jgi:glycosyltransferase involved in cell wall biosynthesis
VRLHPQPPGRMRKILIVGKIPLPIGGITMHVSRLIDALRQRNFEQFIFCDLGRQRPSDIIVNILKYKTIHLHISNPFYQLLLAVFCKLTGKKLLITYHGNWGRYRIPGNWAVSMSAWASFIPIVQNEESFHSARRWNRNVRQISTYIPGSPPIPFSKEIDLRLNRFTENYQTIFCTNAWNVKFDKNECEIYGILSIIRTMQDKSGLALIVSDPSGQYCKFAEDILGKIPDNVCFISESHDFRNVLQFSDAFIRNTTTDGVSLSIYEAMESDVVILASDAVQRPPFCKVFHDASKVNWLNELAAGRKKLDLHSKKALLPDVVSQLTAIYHQCLES